MAIDSHYIPAFSIEDVILDKDTGAPLSGGLVYFEQDNQRGTLKPIYQITGTSPNYSYIQLPNPMTLSSIGTFEDSLQNPVIPYFFPYDGNGDPEYYYVRVTSSEDVPQFAREAQPYIPDSGNTSISSAFANELSNPQFAEVLFDTQTATYVYNFNAANQEAVTIAPGWEIVVSCAAAGSVTVSQIAPVGSLNIVTNPETILNINSAGLSRLRLRQRLYGSPNLWGSGYLAASFIAKTYSGTDTTVTLYYSQSNGTVTDVALVTATLLANGLYAAHPGSALIPASTSTEFFPDAYIDIEFSLPLSTEIDISSVMVASTGDLSFDEIVYDQTSQDRQIDQLFHYYQPQINFKPIQSFLVGWDFALNPAQFLGTNVTFTTTPQYVWDQTIMCSVVGNVNVNRNILTALYGMEIVNVNANEAFYLLQYLSGGEVRRLLGTKLSVNVNTYVLNKANLVCRVYLFRAPTATAIPTLPTTIGTIAASGVFTLTAAGWTEIPRGNYGAAVGNVLNLTTDDQVGGDEIDLKFNGWEVTDAAQIVDSDKFAIVVTYQTPTASSELACNSISLVPGNIPTRPAPQTPNEVLIGCEYYYQKSFNVIAPPAQNNGVNTGESNFIQGKAAGLTTLGPNVKFPIIMRTDPTVTLYNPAAANAQIRNLTVAGDYSASTAINVRQKGFSTAGTSNAGSAVGDIIGVHWVADARLAVV